MRAVRAVAGAVEDERERRAAQPVLGQAGGGVGVVVLHLDRLGVALPRPLARQVVGMHVAGDHLRPHAEHGQVQLEVGSERAVGGLGVEVAEVRREVRRSLAGDAEGALELGPRRHDRPARGHGQRQRRRRVPARAADRKLRPHDRVLAAAVDRAVVGEEGVGDPAELLAGVGVGHGDRLVGAVAARHDERAGDVGDQQVVQRRVGQEQAQPRRPRRHRVRDGRPGPPAHEHDRARGRAQQRELGRVQVGQLARRGRHHREGLLVAQLARTQARDRGLVGRRTGQVVAAEALDRDHRPAAQQPHRLLERHRQARPADGAGDRLGVEAAVARVLVLAPALGAQREAGHGRVRAVVGEAAHDREARAALGAVDERVAVAAIAGIGELAQALVAGGHVGRHERRHRRGGAALDHEVRARRARARCASARRRSGPGPAPRP